MGSASKCSKGYGSVLLNINEELSHLNNVIGGWPHVSNDIKKWDRIRTMIISLYLKDQ